MDADLDTLCTVIYCTADDLLPDARPNARRRVTDAELVTLCVAQAIMGIPSDRRFLRAARRQLGHLFPVLPTQSAYWRRRRRLAGALEWLLGVFASTSPGSRDDLLLVGSTPVPCAASRETVKRSALPDAAGYGYCAAHSRWYWGLRLHPAGRPRRHAARLHARRSAPAAPASGAHPPAHREHLLDLQGPAHARASRGAHLGGTARAHPRASSAWPPASASTIGWAGRAGHSSTTAPEAVGVESII